MKKWILAYIVCTVMLLVNSIALGQSSGSDGRSSVMGNENQIVLSKVITGNTIIVNKTAFVGGFDMTYIITGNSNNIKASEDLIISSIVEDFTKSPTAGYVKISLSASNSSDIQIGNPFASNEQINQKIQELLHKSISEVTNMGLLEVRCSFGNSLDLFSCLTNPLVE